MPKKSAKKAAPGKRPAKKAKKDLSGRSTSVVEPGANVVVDGDSDGNPDAVESTVTTDAPAVDPEIAERDQRMKDRLLVLADHGIVMTAHQYQCLSDENMRLTNRWIETLRQDLSSPPPVGLMAFATDAVREKLFPSRGTGLPPRKFFGCRFGKISIGDQTASVPLKIDKERFTPNEADEFLCGRRVEAVVVLESNADRNQERLFDEDEPKRVDTICDIKSYRGSVKWWSFGLTFQLQEIDVDSLGHFGNRHGRCELQLLGDAKGDDDNGKSKPGQTTIPPHPDVEMGKDKPHGTPALDALAETLQERGETLGSDTESENRSIEPTAPAEADNNQFGEGLDEGPATIPFARPNSDLLPLGMPQLAASLRIIKADSFKLADVFHTWPAETHEQIDTWAKVLAAHAAGDTSTALPDVPDCLKPLLPEEQIAQPVGYARAFGDKKALLWHCVMCDEEWSVSKPRVCSDCSAKGDDVVLIGFYGEPAVTFEGTFIGPEVEEFLVLPETKTFHVAVRVAEGTDKRWRAALHLECVPTNGDPERINHWPSIRDTGRASKNDAIATAIGKLITRWQPLTCELREPAVSALKEYLSQIESGADSLELEQALPDAK